MHVTRREGVLCKYNTDQLGPSLRDDPSGLPLLRLLRGLWRTKCGFSIPTLDAMALYTDLPICYLFWWQNIANNSYSIMPNSAHRTQRWPLGNQQSPFISPNHIQAMPAMNKRPITYLAKHNDLRIKPTLAFQPSTPSSPLPSKTSYPPYPAPPVQPGHACSRNRDYARPPRPAAPRSDCSGP